MSEDFDNEFEFVIREELNGVVPEPEPARLQLPDWYKNLPMERDGGNVRTEINNSTVRACIPFLEALKMGYILHTTGDVYVEIEDGQLKEVESDAPYTVLQAFKKEVVGGDSFPHEGPILHWRHYWRVNAPEGTSMLYLPLLNKPGHPFTAFSGVVDLDDFGGNTNIPALWEKGDWSGTIPHGTPICQVVPFHRDGLLTDATMRAANEEDKKNMEDYINMMKARQRAYREELWKMLPTFKLKDKL